MKKILITGGAGYVGSNLIYSLINKNPELEIVSLDNYFTGKKDNHVDSDRVTYVDGNTWDIRKIFKKNDFDQIFHFGEYSRIVHSFDDIEFVHKSIILGTYEVLNFALENNSKLIYSASSSKFGNNGKDENLSPYAFFKSKNIELIKNYREWFGLNYEISYFFNVYGKNHIAEGKYATVIAIFENQFKLNKPLTVVGEGNQSRDFTHIDDVCNALIKISNKNICHEYHLRYGKNYKIIDVAKQFSENITHIPVRRGERFNSEYFDSDTNKIINWTPKIELFKYIKEFKNLNY